MQIKKLTIHNFRSIKDAEIVFEDYSILLGANNAGKSNIIRALLIFYEEIKYNEKVDFPKFDTGDDKESWVEIEFLTTEEEQETLREDYQDDTKILKVRKFFQSNENERVEKDQSNIFGYESGILSKNYFYGAKNIGEAKVGSIVYIPEIYKIDESLKMSGPSPLRGMLDFVITKITKNNEKFKDLETGFKVFNENFEAEAEGGVSIQNLSDKINEEMEGWNIQFSININPLKPSDIIKNLLSHHIHDTTLKDEMKIDSYGQGLQRNLIYTLLRLADEYKPSKDKVGKMQKEFLPDFTLILFEEPELFLHPSQQEKINTSLQSLGKSAGQQIVITTHSPIFISKNINNLSSLIKLKKEGKESKVFQINETEVAELSKANTGLYKVFRDALDDSTIAKGVKKTIRDGFLRENDDLEIELEKETFNYFLWIDGERASAFFAEHIVICEGATERIALNYLIDTTWKNLKGKHIYILDTLGKYNIHRYMNLFEILGINHSVLMDRDKDKSIQKIINEFIEDEAKGSKFLTGIECLPDDIEEFLGVKPPANETQVKENQKPLSLLYKLDKKEIDDSKLTKLKELFEKLIGFKNTC